MFFESILCQSHVSLQCKHKLKKQNKTNIYNSYWYHQLKVEVKVQVIAHYVIVFHPLWIWRDPDNWHLTRFLHWVVTYRSCCQRLDSPFSRMSMKTEKWVADSKKGESDCCYRRMSHCLLLYFFLSRGHAGGGRGRRGSRGGGGASTCSGGDWRRTRWGREAGLGILKQVTTYKDSLHYSCTSLFPLFF